MKFSNIAKTLGQRGGKKSAEKRFAGKSKKEISESMKKVRLSKVQKKKFSKVVTAMVDNLNENVAISLD